MILTRLMGGLGNQMFQYACGKSLALARGTELVLDPSLLGAGSTDAAEVPRQFDLTSFHFDERLATPAEVALFNGWANPSLPQRMIHRLRRLGGRHPLILQRGNSVDPTAFDTVGKDACLIGRWQSESFFMEHSSVIRHAFRFTALKPTEHAQAVAETLTPEDCVFIQTRRRDYVTNPRYARTLGALDQDYFRNAMRYIGEILSQRRLRFFFGGDDINWCRQAFHDVPNAVFLNADLSQKGYWSHLWLLSQFKHGIICNGTYAWWGAWLGEKQGSVIIAPRQWSRTPEEQPEHIIPARWHQLNSSFEPLG